MLAEGLLTYADYEAWRKGAITCLEEVLLGDHAQIQMRLNAAGAYARALKLQAERRHCTVWGRGSSGQRLCFSQDSAFNTLLQTCYRKASDQPQMDLFMDAPGTRLANGIVLALIERNSTKARELLDRLDGIEPDHVRFGRLARLVAAEARLLTPVDDVVYELDYLHNELTPLAEALLLRNSRSLLIPHWRRLTLALQGKPFDPGQPDLHCSYTAAQALDWEGVQQAVVREPGWRKQPTLIQRYAQASALLRQPLPSLLAWFELCWSFPDHASVIATAGEHEWQQAWNQFIDLEPALDSNDFPAWLLVYKPGLTQILPAPDEATGAPADYVIVFTLQQRTLLPGAKLEVADIALRAKLKQLNSKLFEHYVQRPPIR